MHGVRGKIAVKGRTFEMEMPPLGIFDDDLQTTRFRPRPHRASQLVRESSR